jgi:hypothetical protein
VITKNPLTPSPDTLLTREEYLGCIRAMTSYANFNTALDMPFARDLVLRIERLSETTLQVAEQTWDQTGLAEKKTWGELDAVFAPLFWKVMASAKDPSRPH